MASAQRLRILLLLALLCLSLAHPYHAARQDKSNPAETKPAIPSKPQPTEQSLPKDVWPLKDGTEYVAFGDSYAAGMGAGETTSSWWPGTPSCRRGSGSYGHQLDIEATRFGHITHTYQEQYCSGDTTIGVNRQIDEWQDPGRATLATLSVGGNDLGFSDIVNYCLVQAQHKSENLRKCGEAKATALFKMGQTGAGSFREEIKKVYNRILDKPGARTELQLYVTGYPQFFNEDTDRCDKVTFDFWNTGYYEDPKKCDGCAFLTKKVRKELNDMNRQLNKLIQDVINEVGKQRMEKEGKARIYFVDNDAVFEGHRWCERDVEEPAPLNTRQWFFLSAWEDVTWKDNREHGPRPGEMPDFNTEAELTAESYQEAPPGALPSKSQCEQAEREDPFMKHWYCMAAEVGEDKLRASHVKWAPTRWIKTFHPRSIGYTATKFKIMEKFYEVSRMGQVDETRTGSEEEKERARKEAELREKLKVAESDKERMKTGV